MSTSVIVTGGSGFVAQWVVKHLLDSNYQVITTVRSENKKRAVESGFEQFVQSGSLIVEIVPDLSKKGCLDSILEAYKCKYVFSVASIFSLGNIQDFKRDLVDPNMNMTANAYESAKKYGVERLVFVGSMACVFNKDFNQANANGHVYTEKDFNDMLTYEQACSLPKEQVMISYAASKALSEQKLIQLQAQDKEAGVPHPDVVSIHPPWILGPTYYKLNSADELGESDSLVADLVLKRKPTKVVDEALAFYNFVDVRDLAAAILLCATQPKAANNRYLVSSSDGKLYTRDMVEAINQYTDAKLEVPEQDTSSKAGLDISRTVKDLNYKSQYTVEQSVGELAKQIAAL